MEEHSQKNKSNQSSHFPIVESANLDKQFMQQIVVSTNYSHDDLTQLPSKQQECCPQKIDLSQKNVSKKANSQNTENLDKLRQQNSQLTKHLSRLRTQCSKKKKSVSAIFDELKPGLEQSISQVRNISQNDLNMLRSFARPPQLLCLALKPIYLLLQGDNKNLPSRGRDAINWLDLKVVLSQNFLRRVSEFRIGNMSHAIVDYVQREYLEADQWNVNIIRKVSSVAFILAKWTEYQILYFELLVLVQPIRQEIAMIQNEGDKLIKQQRLIVERILQTERILANVGDIRIMQEKTTCRKEEKET